MWWALLGGGVLVFYGIVATWQPTHFGRVYAAYGGVFIVMALLWGWRVDGRSPDHPELFGAGLALISVAVMMFWPRSRMTPLP